VSGLMRDKMQGKELQNVPNPLVEQALKQSRK
jgi:hypothetical protein